MADEYILNTTDYEFTLVEHQGLGGTRKYIASPKKKQMPKLLVKHGGEYSPSCSNYMYSRTGKAIGVTIPQSYIMRIAERDKHLFDSPCAVGIEFIDGLQPVDLESIQGNKKLESDMINCFVLAGLFTRFEDLMQTAYLPSVAVYPLDFDESFSMDNGLFNCIMRDDQYAEDAVVRVLRNCRQNNQERCLEIAMEVAAKTLKLRTDEVRMIAMKLLRQFVALTEDQIDSIAEPLDEVFTPLLAIYYEEYVHIIQEKVRSYIGAPSIPFIS